MGLRSPSGGTFGSIREYFLGPSGDCLGPGDSFLGPLDILFQCVCFFINLYQPLSMSMSFYISLFPSLLVSMNFDQSFSTYIHL